MTYKHALVLGKFNNPHKGHIALMKFAATKAEYLTVLICETSKDPVDALKRMKWIKNELYANPNIEVVVLNTEHLCQREDSNEQTSKQYADMAMARWPTLDVFVGSEDYIHMMADAVGIDGIVYDKERKNYPISSTAVREGEFEKYCPAAKADLVKSIHVIGPESAGKTELCKRLAKHFGCNWVPETHRRIFEIAGDDSYFTPDLLVQGALMHKAVQTTYIRQAKKPLLIVDSDSITTRAYAHIALGHSPNLVTQICKNEKPHLTLVCSPEVGFVQDGTRMNEDRRTRLFESMRGMCNTFRKDRYVVITSGDYEERFKQAVGAINATLS